MTIEIRSPKIASVTGTIRLLTVPEGIALYMADTRPATPSWAPFYDFETILAPLPLDSGSMASMATVTLPQPLSPPPSWDLSLSRDGSLNVAYTVFGGGWNICEVGVAKDGVIADRYAYGPGDCGSPRLVRNTATDGAQTVLASAILDYRQLGLLLPQTADGKGDVSVALIPLVDAGSGVVFGDLGSGIPTSVTLIYKTDSGTGPLSPAGLFRGSLAFASCDLSTQARSAVQPILGGTSFYELDAAFQGGVYCLLASTDDGAPLLAAVDSTGKLLGTPFLPFGSWSNSNRWIASPTITADPRSNVGDSLGFKFAFVEHEGDSPIAVYLGSVAVSPVAGVLPSTTPAG